MTRNLIVSSQYNDGEYIRKNPKWHLEDSPWEAKQIEKIMLRNNLNPTTMCEVGCGAGEILRQLSLKGQYAEVFFTGYEISEDAYNLCLTRASKRLNFFNSDFQNEKKYDIALCIDVFEHVENCMEFLRNFKEVGELKIFHIPLDLSVNWLIRERLVYARKSVGHLHHFTPDTAIATLIDCDYQIIDMMYTPSFLLQSKSWKAELMKLPRYGLYVVAPKLVSTILGGVSLMVLAK